MSKDYSDILNRKTIMDKVSDAFTDQANSMRPMNVGQRREQALMRGLGVGFGLNPEREAKLAELENMSKELAMNKYGLEMQSGKNELKKQKLLSFLNENHAGLSQLSEYIYAGKHNEVDILAPEILKNYSDITGDKIGKFSHYKNGYATFIDDGGEPKTINIKNLIQPVMDLLPTDQKKEYRGFLSPLQNADIDRMVKAQELQMQKYQADIEASKAHTELYKLQTDPDMLSADMDYKKAQAEKLRQEAKYVGKDSNKELLKKLQTSNIDFLEETHDNIKSKEKQLGAYENIGKLITEEFQSTWNRSGAGLISKAQRFLNPSFTDASRRQAQIDMEKEPLYHEIRKIFTGAVSDKDVALFVTTLPDLNNSYEANMTIIENRKKALEEDLFKLKSTRDLIQNSDYSTHFTHTSIQDKVEELNKERIAKIEAEKLNSNNKIKLQLEDGSINIYDKEQDKEIINELLNNKLAKQLQ